MQHHITTSPLAVAAEVGRAYAHTYTRPRPGGDGFGVHIMTTTPPERGLVTERWTWHSDPAAPTSWSLDRADQLLTALGWHRVDEWTSTTTRSVVLRWTCAIEP